MWAKNTGYHLRISARIQRRTLKNPAISGWSVKRMLELGQTAVQLIEARTFDRGEGIDDKPHKSYQQLTGKDDGYGAYSPRWGRVRAGLAAPPKTHGKTAGRKGKTRKTSSIDLTFSGAMRRGLRTGKVTRFTVLVGVFGSAAARAKGTHDLRPWLGLSPKDRKKLIRDALRLMRGAR